MKKILKLKFRYSLIAVFFIFLLSATIFLAVLGGGCGNRYPDQEDRHGVGDKYDVALNEEITYSIEILAITHESFVFRITNKNPNIRDYNFIIEKCHQIIDSIAIDGTPLVDGEDSILAGYGANFYYVPFIESSVDVFVKLTPDYYKYFANHKDFRINTVVCDTKANGAVVYWMVITFYFGW